MAIKKFKPTTPSRRYMTVSDFEKITKTEPEKNLLEPIKKSGGRNSEGGITSRRRGGGHKRRYRVIDFKRDKDDIPAKVNSIEYDPNRSALIALLFYKDGEKRYILAPDKLDVGDEVISGDNVDIRPGNAVQIKNIPIGTIIHNVELQPGKGGQIARAAGTMAQVLAKEEKFVHVKMPSGEVRLIRGDCRATVGQLGNIEHENITGGKAGRTRWRGKRPSVRGVVMNPVDHPHGGGEGKSPPGRHPVTPWGKKAKGKKTRKRKKTDDKIVRSRHETRS